MIFTFSGTSTGFFIEKNVEKTLIIESIAKLTHLEPYKDVVVHDEALYDPEISQNAKLWVDIKYFSKGFAVSCEVSGSKIADLDAFAEKIPKLLNSPVFFPTGEYHGYLIGPDGGMQFKKYDVFEDENGEEYFLAYD